MPNDQEINLPVKIGEGGKIDFQFGPAPSRRPRHLIASCKIGTYEAKVFKDSDRRTAEILQTKDGQVSKKSVPYVFTQKITKDMLGQYSAAIEIAQQLGITQVDYAKIYLVDPQLEVTKSKALIFFYDTDDEVIDRTILSQEKWTRCQEND